MNYILYFLLAFIWVSLPVFILLEYNQAFACLWVFSFIFDYIYFVKLPSAKKMYVFNKLKNNYKMTFVLRQLYFLLFLSGFEILSSEVLALYVLIIVFQQVSFICVQFPYEKIQKANLPFAIKNIKASAKYLKYVRSPAKYKKKMMDLCLYSEIFSLLGLFLHWNNLFSYKMTFILVLFSFIFLIGYSVFVYYRVFRNVDSGVYINNLHEQVVKKRPSVVVHFSGNSSSTYQLNTWLSVLEKIDRKVLVVVREKHHSEHILKTALPIIFVSKLKDLEFFIPACVKVALYVANVGPNLHLLRNFRMKHVFLGHGDSDKVSSMNNFTRVYDRIYVAGQAAIERYRSAGVDVSDRAFEIIGRPQLSEIKTVLNDPSEKINILYAPTWEGYFKDSDYSSFYLMAEDLINFVISHSSEYSLTIKPHPLTGLVDPLIKKHLVYLKNKVNPHICIEWVDSSTSSKSLFDCFNDSALMITDVSSVMSDYLQSEKPLVLTNPRSLKEQEVNEVFPVSRGAYILNNHEGAILELLSRIKVDDYLLSRRQSMKSFILGGVENPLEQFNCSINSLYYESINNAGDFEVKEAREGLEFEMLEASTNNGGYSKAGNIWIRSDYGYIDNSYFLRGDILRIHTLNKDVAGLCKGDYKVVDAEYSFKELDYKLKIRPVGEVGLFEGWVPSNAVSFSIYSATGEAKLGKGNIFKDLNDIKSKEDRMFREFLSERITNSGGSSIGAIWFKHDLGPEIMAYLSCCNAVNVLSVSHRYKYKGVTTSSSFQKGEYTISDVVYSQKEKACQIKLNYIGLKPIVAKGDVEFTLNFGEKFV